MIKLSLLKKKTFHGLQGRYLTVYTLLRIKLADTEISFCIHNIHRADEDPDCHCHPWKFISLILIGGYREFAEDGSFKIRKPLSIAYRPATHRQRVAPLTKHC